MGGEARTALDGPIAHEQMLWALGSLSALHGRPFAADLVARDFPPPGRESTLILAARQLGFASKRGPCRAD